MSEFTNPAVAAAEQAETYIKAVMRLIDDLDPIDVLDDMPEKLRRSIEDLSAEEIARSPRPEKWSIQQVLNHLQDSELMWSVRLRRVLAEDRPTLYGYDQDLWAEALHYEESDHEQTLAVFAAVRAANLSLLRSISKEDLERVGVHLERGDESVGHMIRLYAGHDLVHLKQIEKIRREL